MNLPKLQLDVLYLLLPLLTGVMVASISLGAKSKGTDARPSRSFSGGTPRVAHKRQSAGIWSRLGGHELRNGSRFAGLSYPLEFLKNKSGVVLGRMGMLQVRLLERDSVIVFGPTQSYKTTRLVVPAIVKFEGAVIAASVKDDIVVGANAAMDGSDFWVFDPYSISKVGNCFWNPIPADLPDREAKHLASVLCTPREADRANEESLFWYALAARMLAPLLVAASFLKLEVSAILTWVELRDFAEAAGALQQLDRLGSLRTLQASLDREERQLSSVVTTLEKCLEPFIFGTSRHPLWHDVAQFVPHDRARLFLLAPPNRQSEVGPVFSALLRIQLDKVFAARERTRLLLVLDEAANIAPIANLDEVVSVVAAYQIQMMTIFQDFAQVRSKYGEKAATVLNNHRAKLFLGAISDPETLGLAEMLCGQSFGSGSGRGKFTGDQSLGDRALLSRGGLRSLRPGSGLLIYGHRRPALVRLH